jgi:hypothetical protein
LVLQRQQRSFKTVLSDDLYDLSDEDEEDDDEDEEIFPFD